MGSVCFALPIAHIVPPFFPDGCSASVTITSDQHGALIIKVKGLVGLLTELCSGFDHKIIAALE